MKALILQSIKPFVLLCYLMFLCSCNSTDTLETPDALETLDILETLDVVETPDTQVTDKKIPVIENTTGKTIIQRTSSNKEWLSDVTIISSTGTVIYCDAFQTPEDIITELKPDILCVTHKSHIEHVDQKLIDQYKDNADCRMSIEKEEDFSYKDVNVIGMESSHGLLPNPEYADNKNVVYIFEVDGLRIAHMGGMNQSELSQEQLDKLGDIDIMFVSLSMYGNMDIDHVYSMCEILKPSIIIPTHCDNPQYLEKLSSMVESNEQVDNVLVVSKEDLDGSGSRLLILNNTLFTEP